MRTIAILMFVLFIGVSVQAQTESNQVSIGTLKINLVSAQKSKNATLNRGTKVARLYREKNSNVKKALSFTTRKNTTKMA